MKLHTPSISTTIPSPISTPTVTLLSAGPGDLELLTLKAVRALGRADVVLVDELVNPEITQFCPQAQQVWVGKRGGCRSTPQAFIQRLMRRYARQGKQVVRVKGGEALLFGRAGEEIAYLQGAGIAVDIINGVSSGLAAAASLKVSLTHREHCRGVCFVTAHAQDDSEPDWKTLAATGMTLAIYMGMGRIQSICTNLVQYLPAHTPAAVVQWVSSAHQGQVLGRLGDIASLAEQAGLGSPAVILIGDAIGEAQAFSTMALGGGQLWKMPEWQQAA